MQGITFEPTPVDRRMVKTMSAYGIPQRDIAACLEISEKTLRKRFREDLRLGQIEANTRVAEALFKSAVIQGNVTAQIFWCKTRLGWRENKIND